MTAKDIQKILTDRFTDHKYQLKNVYIYGPKWESDWFSITTRDLAMEIEIKISRNDYHLDFKKHLRHQTLQSANSNTSITRRVCPNIFYFCAPSGLLWPEEIPEYAGLFEIDGDKLVMTKKAPVLHTDKSCLKDILVDKFYYRTINLERQIRSLQQDLNFYLSDGYYQWVSQNPHKTIPTTESPVMTQDPLS